MSAVRYPSMRDGAMTGIAKLSDPEYQQRAFVRREPFPSGGHDDLRETIAELYDGTQVLSCPEDLVGDVLLPGDEVARLRALDAVLGPLIDELGDAPAERYTTNPRWPGVVAAAAAALAAMVIAGPGVQLPGEVAPCDTD